MQQSIGFEAAIGPNAAQSCGCYCCASWLVGALCCTPLYFITGGFCCGYCQGQECCKCRSTEFLEACCAGE